MSVQECQAVLQSESGHTLNGTQPDAEPGLQRSEEHSQDYFTAPYQVRASPIPCKYQTCLILMVPLHPAWKSRR